MSKSWRTEPSRRQAGSRIRRDADGLSFLPRIVVHPPRRGAVYLLDKQLLLALLRCVPIDYRYGLRAIELRARKGLVVGRPFATYNTRERVIRVYSTPTVEWPLPKSSPGAFEIYEKFGAKVLPKEDVDLVKWNSPGEAARFLFGRVFAHELGHHFDHQYKHKWKLPASIQGEEAAAEKHMHRLEAWRIFNFVSRARLPNDG